MPERRELVEIIVRRRTGCFTELERSRIFGVTRTEPHPATDRKLVYESEATASVAEEVAADIRREFPRLSVTLSGPFWD